MPSAGALVSHTSITDTLRLQPYVAASIADIADGVLVPTDFSVVIHTAVEWNITACLTAFFNAAAFTMRVFFAFECLVIAHVPGWCAGEGWELRDLGAAHLHRSAHLAVCTREGDVGGGVTAEDVIAL